MAVFKAPDRNKGNEFYQKLASGHKSGYVWGLDKRFDPDKVAFSPSVQEHFTAKVAAHISTEHQVLDVGCGAGAFLPALSPLCGQLTAFDISTDFVDQSRATVDHYQLANTSIFRASADSLPFPDRSFDVVVAVDVLHHLDCVAEALLETNRVLKPGGKLLVFEPNKLNLLLFATILFDRNEWGALRLGSKRAYRNLIKNLFRLEFIEYNGLLIGPDSPLNRFLVDLMNKPYLSKILAWQNPKLFMVMSQRTKEQA